MPLYSGHGKHTIEKNISIEVRAGRPTRQAVAIAFAKARESVKPVRHVRETGDSWTVEVTSKTLPGTTTNYNIVWKKRGVARAYRHVETRSLQRAKTVFANFVRQAEHDQKIILGRG